MPYTALSASATSAYSDLLDALLLAPFPARGLTFITRKVKGRTYWYLQHTIGADKRSYYLGPDSEDHRARIARAQAALEAGSAEVETRRRLVRTGVAAGLASPNAAETRVYEAMAQSGVFAAGGLLVGTHAYLALGNMLGVRWEAGARTEDIDVGYTPAFDLAVPAQRTPLPEALREAGLDFIPVPALDSRLPPTEFRIRGQRLTVSLLTPLQGPPRSKPVEIPGLGHAEALRFLDFLLEDGQPVAIPAGSGVLAAAPAPGRFALHKLVVSQRRPAAMAGKSRKDLEQAANVLSALADFRPGEIDAGLEAARTQGGRFLEQLRSGARALPQELREWITDDSR